MDQCKVVVVASSSYQFNKNMCAHVSCPGAVSKLERISLYSYWPYVTSWIVTRVACIIEKLPGKHNVVP